MTLVKFNSGKTNNGSLMPGFNDVFDSIFNDTFFNDRMVTRVPAANISETEDHYHVELAAPGLKKEQQSENSDVKKNYSKREYSYTSFVRSFTLPESANSESIEATYTDGVLKIDIAKRDEAKTIRRQIEIK
jgi:HSP20 family protein